MRHVAHHPLTEGDGLGIIAEFDGAERFGLGSAVMEDVAIAWHDTVLVILGAAMNSSWGFANRENLTQIAGRVWSKRDRRHLKKGPVGWKGPVPTLQVLIPHGPKRDNSRRQNGPRPSQASV